MRYISASDVKQELAKVLDTVQREPVIIKRQKRDAAVMLSMQEYEKLTAINLQDFKQFCEKIASKAKTKGLTEQNLQKILSSDE